VSDYDPFAAGAIARTAMILDFIAKDAIEWRRLADTIKRPHVRRKYRERAKLFVLMGRRLQRAFHPQPDDNDNDTTPTVTPK